MHTRMRSAAAIGVVGAAAVTVGTLSTLAARAGAAPTVPTDVRASGSANGVRVDISDDTRSAHTGDVIDYMVRVANESGTAYPGLEVFHLVPAGFQLVDSSPRATQEDRTVRWTGDLPAGSTLVFTDQVMAGTVEESMHLAPRTRDAGPSTATHQFTSTACARASSTGSALACGTVHQQLTDSPDAAAGATGPAAKHWEPGLLGIGLLAACYTAFRGFFRKRRERRDEE